MVVQRALDAQAFSQKQQQGMPVNEKIWGMSPTTVNEQKRSVKEMDLRSSWSQSNIRKHM